MIDKRGDMLMNAHVVDGGGSIRVRVLQRTQGVGEPGGTGSSSDIAVIRVSVPTSELRPLTFGDSSKVQVGDGVVAIGSPFGLSGSATTGIVSALDRSITAPNRTRSPARSRPTRRSTAATRAGRCSTRTGT